MEQQQHSRGLQRESKSDAVASISALLLVARASAHQRCMPVHDKPLIIVYRHLVTS